MGKVVENFADRLLKAIDQKKSRVVVGLDPDINKIPKHLIYKHQSYYGKGFKGLSSAVADFNFQIIDATADIAVAVKPQIAFYEALGIYGLITLRKTIRYAKSRNLLIIQDAKRGDIGSTAEAYALAHIGSYKGDLVKKVNVFGADAVTVNPLLGSDGMEPFIKRTQNEGKGIFVLVKTSNPSSGEIQDLESMVNGRQYHIYEIIAELVNRWGSNSVGKRGYSSVGAVVGATFPEQAKSLRNIMPNVIFLVPGYGAQGGTARDVVNCFNSDGYGAIVNSSRDIIYAYQKIADSSDSSERIFSQAARDAAERMRKEIQDVL
jgi:orotidine-5'-phosphate decarboxylase